MKTFTKAHLDGSTLRKVFQDSITQVVFKDSQETYYATTKPWSIELPVTHTLEEYRKNNRISDKWGNVYRTLEWAEIRDLTWKGRPLFMEVSSRDTTLPGTTAYQGETGPQPWKPNEKAVPTASERTTAVGPRFPAFVPQAPAREQPRPELGRPAGYVPAAPPARPLRCPHVPSGRP